MLPWIFKIFLCCVAILIFVIVLYINASDTLIKVKDTMKFYAIKFNSPICLKAKTLTVKELCIC